MGTSREPVRLALRNLWSEHIIWTHQYIVAAVAGTPDVDAAAKRLLRNQDDIGQAIVPYYGEEAATALAGFLRDHILIAVDLVAAAKSGDNDAFAVHDRRWSDNVIQIADFLSTANPHWGKQDVLDLLNLHLKLTKESAVARLTADWDADVRALDEIFTEAMVIADTLYDGIVAQFPDRFGTAVRELAAVAA